MNDKHIVATLLNGWANEIVARYGHPVYLVGSALQTPNDIDYARDIDVVCILPDIEFNNRFCEWQYISAIGCEPWPGAVRWAAECAKLSRWVAQHISGVNLDFKIQSESWVSIRHPNKPRLRIDTVGFTTCLKPYLRS